MRTNWKDEIAPFGFNDSSQLVLNCKYTTFIQFGKMETIRGRFKKHITQIKKIIGSDNFKDILGVEAVNHFKSSFDNEGFEDKNVKKWDNVKRRDPLSVWYGHSSKKKGFSSVTARNKILKGETNELREANTYRRTPKGVVVLNSKKYARVHQFGGKAYIYGKKQFTMKARPFMGQSEVLNKNIRAKLVRELKKQLLLCKNYITI